MFKVCGCNQVFTIRLVAMPQALWDTAIRACHKAYDKACCKAAFTKGAHGTLPQGRCCKKGSQHTAARLYGKPFVASGLVAYCCEPFYFFFKNSHFFSTYFSWQNTCAHIKQYQASHILGAYERCFHWHLRSYIQIYQ